MTPSLARLVGAQANSLKRPVKWFHIGEHFRYEKPQKGRTRSFFQFNADILGEPGVGADAELIALCVHALQAFGLTERDFKIRLSDRDLWLLYLAGFGLEGDRALAVLQIVDKAGREERADTLKQLSPFFAQAAEDFLAGFDLLTSVHSFEELRAFMLRQVPDGKLREAISKRLKEWERLLAFIEAMRLQPFVEIDLSVVRGLAYYTGFVFEAFERAGKSRALAGGGRYDHLIKKLGYPDLPATGFAMGDVTLANLLEEKKRLPSSAQAPGLFVIIGGEEEWPSALSDIARLRAEGFSVEYPLALGTGFSRQFKKAGQSGASLALIYGSEERACNAVKVRDLQSGEESLVPRPELSRTLKNAFRQKH